jgi:hypothetical protein
MEADRQAALIAALREMAQRAGNRIAGGGVRGAATRGFLGMDAPEDATPMQRDVYENVSRASAPVMGLAAAPMVLAKGLRAAPRAEALETARQNAVKMLGLPENNTAMDRAKALGYVDDTYHGTFNRFDNFDMAKASTRSQYMPGIFTADDPRLAENFGDYVLPLMQRKGTTVLDKRAAREAGLPLPQVDTIHDKTAGIRVTNDPTNIRSRFAAFDPARVNENDLLGRADPRLLAGLAAGAGATTAAVAALRRKKDEEKDGK